MNSAKAMAALCAVILLATPVAAVAGSRPTLPATFGFLLAPVLPAAATTKPGTSVAPSQVTIASRQSKKVKRVNRLLGNILPGLFGAFATTATVKSGGNFKSRGAA